MMFELRQTSILDERKSEPMFIELIPKEVPNSVDEVLCHLEKSLELKDKNGMEGAGVQFMRRWICKTR
jgi:hypothetical protein